MVLVTSILHRIVWCIMLDNMSTGTKYMERQTLYGFFSGPACRVVLNGITSTICVPPLCWQCLFIYKIHSSHQCCIWCNCCKFIGSVSVTLCWVLTDQRGTCSHVCDCFNCWIIKQQYQHCNNCFTAATAAAAPSYQHLCKLFCNSHHTSQLDSTELLHYQLQ